MNFIKMAAYMYRGVALTYFVITTMGAMMTFPFSLTIDS